MASTNIIARCRILGTDPLLRRLHSELVANGKISEEEFWSIHAQRVQAEEGLLVQKPGKTLNLGTGPKVEATSSTDTQIRYTLTQALIKEIMATSPAVKTAYEELVEKGKRISRQVFWESYFKSPLFNPKLPRDPNNLLTPYITEETEEIVEEPEEVLDLVEVEEEARVYSLGCRDQDVMSLISKINRTSMSILKPLLAGYKPPEENTIVINEAAPKAQPNYTAPVITSEEVIEEQPNFINLPPFEATAIPYTEFKAKFLTNERADIQAPSFSDEHRFLFKKINEVLRLFWRTCMPLTSDDALTRASNLIELLAQMKEQMALAPPELFKSPLGCLKRTEQVYQEAFEKRRR